jgi:hypothetical protein
MIMLPGLPGHEMLPGNHRSTQKILAFPLPSCQGPLLGPPALEKIMASCTFSYLVVVKTFAYLHVFIHVFT